MAIPIRLEVTDLALARGPRILFRDLSFTVGAGEAVALMGDNGAGKTSLLRAIAGLLKPAEGRVLFRGADGELDAGETVRGQTHLIGHADGLAGSRSARAELFFSVDWTGGSRAVALKTAEGLGLGRVLDLDVRKLSAGQRRRLALIRLAATPRALWLLDEPMTALDAASRSWAARLMAGHLEAGGLIVAAAHDALPVPATVVRVGC
jgi:heme exporter protein A